MPTKPDAKPCVILEQIIEDPVTGLTFQFELPPSGEPHLTIFGPSLQFGNRGFVFDVDGNLAGTGTSTRGLCRPGWLSDSDDL